jgi:hypothetical protein
MIDDAMLQFAAYQDDAEFYRCWRDEDYLSKFEKPNDCIKVIIQMQQEFPWLKSKSLLDILRSEQSEESQLGNALLCNVW